MQSPPFPLPPQETSNSQQRKERNRRGKKTSPPISRLGKPGVYLCKRCETRIKSESILWRRRPFKGQALICRNLPLSYSTYTPMGYAALMCTIVCSQRRERKEDIRSTCAFIYFLLAFFSRHKLLSRTWPATFAAGSHRPRRLLVCRYKRAGRAT